MTYGEHYWFSLSLCATFAKGAVGALVHAFVPAWQADSSTRNSNALQAKLGSRQSVVTRSDQAQTKETPSTVQEHK
jgi:hypothetical protein